MSEFLVHTGVFLYGTSLVGQVILSDNVRDKIEVPLVIMYVFQLRSIFPSQFVSITKRLCHISLPKEYRLNRKTRPPNMCWAQ